MGDKKTRSLCEWKGKDIEKNFKAFSSLVRSPKYACSKCGRVAKSKKNLCKPIALG